MVPPTLWKEERCGHAAGRYMYSETARMRM